MTSRPCWRPPFQEEPCGSGRHGQPEPVLKKAGVVDAGGRGLLLILQGMLEQPAGRAHAADGGRRPGGQGRFPPSETRTSPSPSTPCSSSAKTIPTWIWPPSGPIWTASVTVWSSARTTNPSRSMFTPTLCPGEALTAAQRYGTLELAKIENMRTQAADLAAGRKA